MVKALTGTFWGFLSEFCQNLLIQLMWEGLGFDKTPLTL
jgi:hypothetical protein